MKISSKDKHKINASIEKFIDIDYDALVEHNFVTNLHFNKPNVCTFLLKTLCWCTSSTYYPKFDNYNYVTQFKNKYQSVLKSIESAQTDIELYKKLEKMYRLIAFTFNFNMFSIYETSIVSNQNTTTIFKIKDNRTTLQKTSSVEPIIVYHGTKNKCLYSLIRTGPQCFDEFVLNGRAYGNGFYTTSNINLARSYSESYIIIFRLYNANKYAINANNYKMNNIYVVNDTNDLEIIGIVPKNIDNSSINDIFHLSISKPSKLSHTISHKRLLNDIKNLNHLDDCYGIHADIDLNNIFEWKVKFHLFDEDSKLFKDMKSKKIKWIELLIQFNHQYPIEPPFIRVVRPEFKRWTGHVTYGGSICAEILTQAHTKNSWKASISINTLLITIKSLLQIDGRIHSKDAKYTQIEAKEAFQVALKKHGWA